MSQTCVIWDYFLNFLTQNDRCFLLVLPKFIVFYNFLVVKTQFPQQIICILKEIGNFTLKIILRSYFTQFQIGRSIMNIIEISIRFNRLIRHFVTGMYFSTIVRNYALDSWFLFNKKNSWFTTWCHTGLMKKNLHCELELKIIYLLKSY